MKIQKRFVALLVSVVLFAICAVVLTSCGECDHDYGEWTVTTEATCTTPGEAYRVCKFDSDHVETKVIEPIAHTYGEYVSDGRVTCTTNGAKTATCTVCGYNNTVLEDAKGHSFTTYTPNGEATCTTGAPEVAVCDREGCDATDVKYVGAEKGHSYGADGVCTACSDVLANLAKYDISVDGDGSVIATIYETDKTIGTTKNIALLLKISGTGVAVDFSDNSKAPWSEEYGKRIVYVEVDDTVTNLGAYTFAGLEKLTDVKLPTSLIAIPAYAFAECEDLEKITIPASVMVIDASAFVDCEVLEEVTIAEGSEMTVIGESAFEGCKKLEDINLPDTVSVIGASAFNGCKKLDTLNITDSITVFGANAIKDTKVKTNSYKGAKYLAVGENLYAIFVDVVVSELEKESDEAKTGTILTIHKDVVIIPELVLTSYTKDIKVLVVEEGNTVYTSKNNCIIKNGNTVYMGVATSTIPEDASITTIAAYAFYECAGMESITIPANITTIEDEAFRGAANLKTVTMAGSVTEIGLYAFADCEALEELTLSTALTTIGAYTFTNCTALKTVIIPEGVTTVGEAAFSGCAKLETVTYPASITTIEKNAFNGCGFKALVLPESIKYIGEYAFATCKSVTSIDLPDNAEYIGEGAFAGCVAITEITIPATIGYIGNSVFYGCSKLTTVSLYFTGSDAAGTDSSDFAWIFANDTAAMPKIKTVYVLGNAPIAAGAFKNCAIEVVHISSEITAIGHDAFAGCTALKEVHITDIASWCAVDFADYYSNPIYFAKNLYLNGTLVTDLVIPEGVTTIKYAAFNGCSSITTATLPSTLTTLEAAAFKGCSSLKAIVLPESVTTVGTLAFANCGALTGITLSGSITEIAPYVFSGCTELSAINIPASVTNISETAFIGCQRLGKVTVDAANTAYISYCNILYTADKEIYFIPHFISGDVVILDGVTKIKAGAFLNAPYIDTLVVPASVTEIGEAAFGGCTTIKSITLPFIGQSLDCTENSAFKYVFGTVPATLNTVTILGGTKVADGAFKGCDTISTVNLPDGITSIGKEAFADCAGLSVITLPKTVTSVADDAFVECKKLRTVYYTGLSTDLKGENGDFNMTIGANNVYLKGAKFYFYNPTVGEGGEGIFWYINDEGEIVIW